MDKYQDSFRRANAEIRYNQWQLKGKRTGALRFLQKTLHPCYDNFAISQGMRFTVADTFKCGVISHFRSIGEAEQYLMDLLVTRSWLN